MMELLPKLLPVMLFWLLEAIYLGGWPVDVHGGNGPKQVIGLLLTSILWAVVWKAFSATFQGIGPVLGAIVMASFLSAALLPLVNWVGFKIVGVSIRKVDAHAH